MDDDAFWALMNVAALVAGVVIQVVVLSVVVWLNARANRRQFERLTSQSGQREEDS